MAKPAPTVLIQRGNQHQPFQQARDLVGHDIGMLAELVKGRRDQR